MSKQNLYKQIPSVDEIINSVSPELLLIPRNLIKIIIRESIKTIKEKIANNDVEDVENGVYSLVIDRLTSVNKPHLNKVVNGTGIILHTGLGRAPISKDVFSKAFDSIFPYINLEFGLSDGERGERNHHVDYLINAITGSESSIIVNNNAAAVLLVLNTLAEGEKVVISRGQQVEIGGSFRIPDVINKSNCTKGSSGNCNRMHYGT